MKERWNKDRLLDINRVITFFTLAVVFLVFLKGTLLLITSDFNDRKTITIAFIGFFITLAMGFVVIFASGAFLSMKSMKRFDLSKNTLWTIITFIICPVQSILLFVYNGFEKEKKPVKTNVKKVEVETENKEEIEELPSTETQKSSSEITNELKNNSNLWDVFEKNK